MKRFLSVLVFSGTLLLGGGQTLTVQQLISFLRSSIQLKQPDKQVAQYLAHLRLSEKLDDRTIEQLQGEGLGPKTVAALHELSSETATMPSAVIAPPPPKPAPIPPPSYEDQQKVISAMTDYALNYTKRLPDFICSQITRRYATPNGRDAWMSLDTVTAKVSYVEGHENYEVKLVNNTMVENKSIEALGGAISTGEFGSMMKEIFDPESGSEFHWERWTTLRGHRAHVFSYQIDQARSKYSIDWERKRRIITAYRGLVYVDRDSNTILRITAEAVNIPMDFPVRAASSRLDYDFVNISGEEFLLPLVSEMRIGDSEYTMRNNIEFRTYHKFGAGSTIQFDVTPDPLPDSKTQEEPPK
jgi:hypothetical protein